MTSPAPQRRLPAALIPAVLLIGLVLLHLPGLDDPLIGVHHYRMNQTASIARNFHERSMNLFLPRIDWGGAGPGIVEEGFQAYAWVLALLYGVFGVAESVARSFSLALWAASGLVTFLLAQRLYDRRSALWALFFFSVSPMGLYYGHGVQPDPLLVLCSLLALHLMLVWSEEGRSSALWGSAAAVALASLTKPLSLYLGLPLLYLCHHRLGWAFLRSARMWAYAAIALLPSAAWYAWSHTLWTEYGNTAGIWGQGFSMLGTAELWTDPGLYRRLGGYFALHVTTLPGLLLLGLGLVLKRPPGGYVLHAWGLGYLVALVLTAGVQQWHDYYQLPMVAPAAILMGRGARRLLDHDASRPAGRGRPWLATAVLVLLVLALGKSSHSVVRWEYGRVSDRAWDQLAFARRLEELTEPGAIVVLGGSLRDAADVDRHVEPDGFGSRDDPVEFYNSRRRGWSMVFDDDSIEVIEALRRKGGTWFTTQEVAYLDGLAGFRRELDERFTLVERTPKWVVYRLEPDAGR